MQVVGIILWWYSGGLLELFRRIGLKITGVVDYFSIGLLLKTLFAPFRQIDAGVQGRSLSDKFRAFIDRTTSRLIGGMLRGTMIIVGIITIVAFLVVGIVVTALWIVTPLLPIIGLVLSMTRWLPW